MTKQADDRPLTIREANRVARGRAGVFRSKVDPTLWEVTDREGFFLGAYEPMDRKAWLAFLAEWTGAAKGVARK